MSSGISFMSCHVALSNPLHTLQYRFRYQGERTFMEWRYIESSVGTRQHAISVTYTDGYLELPGEDLVLDIAFWRINEGTAVNFVGGGPCKCSRVFSCQ